MARTSQDGSYTELTADGSPKSHPGRRPAGHRPGVHAASTYTFFKATYYNSRDRRGDRHRRHRSVRATRAAATRRSGRSASTLASLATRAIPTSASRRSATRPRTRSTARLLPSTSCRSSEVPGLITNICELLAAGYIDYEEFGKDGEAPVARRSARAAQGHPERHAAPHRRRRHRADTPDQRRTSSMAIPTTRTPTRQSSRWTTATRYVWRFNLNGDRRRQAAVPRADRLWTPL